jgi:hypothetical protein
MSQTLTIAESTGDDTPRWTAHIARLDLALARGDTYAVVYAWHLACLEARASDEWEPMLLVGQAALRVARGTGLTVAFRAEARQALHVALARAQRARSRDGVLRIAETLAEIGDSEAIRCCRELIERMDDSA